MLFCRMRVCNKFPVCDKILAILIMKFAMQRVAKALLAFCFAGSSACYEILQVF